MPLKSFQLPNVSIRPPAHYLVPCLLSALLCSTALRAQEIDKPLRDAALTVAADGTHYLTGTLGTPDPDGAINFDFNNGAPLWSSTDGKSWKPLGLIFDRVDFLSRVKDKDAGPLTRWSPPAEKIDGLLSNAVTTPRVYFYKGNWYLIFAQNGREIVIFKSNKPDGGYEYHGYLATRGGYPSLFFDEDESAYLVFADGWIAKMQPDLKAVAEDIRPLSLASDKPGTGRMTLGDRGVSLFKRDGNYCTMAARWFVRNGKPSHDAVLWQAGSIYGPYKETRVTLPDTGPVSVFKDVKGDWQAVSSEPVKNELRLMPISKPE